MSVSQIRFRHAKRLVAQEFAEAQTDDDTLKKEAVAQTPYAHDPAARRRKSAALVGNREASGRLYTPFIERSRAIVAALQATAPRIRKVCETWCDERRASEYGMVNAVMSELQACFGRNYGGCNFCAYVGLLEPEANAIRIVASSHDCEIIGSRILREKGTVFFKCIDENKTITATTKVAAEELCLNLFEHRTKYPFLCTSLTANGQPVGILAMDGFCEAASSLQSNSLNGEPQAQRPISVENSLPHDYNSRLIPFTRRKDLACKHVKLWRSRDSITGVIESDGTGASASTNVIAGHVCDVDRRHGSRHTIYKVKWEDGRCETDISLRAMKDLLRITPAILGVGVPLDNVHLEFAEYTASMIGQHLSRLREKMCCASILNVLKNQMAKLTDLYQLALEKCMETVLQARAAEIWEYDQEKLIVRARLERGDRFRQFRAPRRVTNVTAKRRRVIWELLRSNATSFSLPFAEEIVVAPLCCESEAKIASLTGESPQMSAPISDCLLSVTRASGVRDQSYVSFLGSIANALGTAAIVMKKRDLRIARRRESLRRVSDLCAESVDQVEAADLRKAVETEVLKCLYGASISVGILRPGGDEVEFHGTREARSTENAIFDCLPPRSAPSRLLRSPNAPRTKDRVGVGAHVEVLYGRVWYPATVVADRGHETFDVTYDRRDWRGRHEKEAGVPLRRLRIPEITEVMAPQDSLLNLRHGPEVWPIIVVPLGRNFGVVCADSCLKHHDEPLIDEPHVVAFLQAVARHLGAALERRERRDAAIQLQSLILGNHEIGRADVKFALIKQLRRCILFASSVQMCSVPELKSSVLPHLGEDEATWVVDQCVALAGKSDASVRNHAFTVGTDKKTFMCLIEDSDVFLNESTGPEVLRKTFLILCTLVPALRYETDLKQEMNFAARMTKIAQENLTSITACRWRSHLRTFILDAFRQACNTSTLQEVLHFAITAVSNRLFTNSRVCVGFLMPSGDAIHFTTTSSGSSLFNRWFWREQKLKLPFFDSVDTNSSLVVGSSDVVSTYQNKRINMVAPWLCVPLARSRTVVRGVITVDSLQHLPRAKPNEPCPDPGALACLESLGVLLGTAVDRSEKSKELERIEALPEYEYEADEKYIFGKVYGAGLQAARRQLLFSRKISLWQLRHSTEISSSSSVAIAKNAAASMNIEDRTNMSVRLRVIRFSISKLSHGNIVCVFAMLLLDNKELGRTTPVPVYAEECDAPPTEEFSISLGRDWINSALKIIVAVTSTCPNITDPIGSVTLQGSTYLHLQNGEQTYNLRGHDQKSLLQSTITVGMSLFNAGTSLRKFSKQVIYSSPSIWTEIQLTSICIEGLRAASYMCIFRDEAGAEIERTAYSCSTASPTWAGLSLPVSNNPNPFARKLILELRNSASDDHTCEVVLRGELSGSVLISILQGERCIKMDLLPLQTVPPPVQRELPWDDAVKVSAFLTLVETIRRPELGAWAELSEGPSASAEPTSVCHLEGESLVIREQHLAVDADTQREFIEAMTSRKASLIAEKRSVPRRIVAPIEDLVACVGCRQVGPSDGSKFAIVVESKRESVCPEDVQYLEAISRAVEKILRKVRLRQLRDAVRAKVEIEIQNLFALRWASELISYLLDTALELSNQYLPGCSLYAGLLQPGGDEIVYVSSNRNSRMRGNRLRRGHGVSFLCIGPKIEQSTVVATTTTDGIHVFGKVEPSLPFVCVPLTVDGLTLGILGADSFDQISNVKDGNREVPEEGIIAFLQSLSVHAAKAIEIRREVDVFLAQPIKGELQRTELFSWALWGLSQVMLQTSLFEVWEMSDNREMRVVARLLSSSEPGEDERDSKSYLPDTKCDAKVIVAPDPAAVRKRIAEDDITRPAMLADTERLNKIAQLNFLFAEFDDCRVLEKSAHAIITELAMGKIVDRLLHSNQTHLHSTILENEPKRVIIPCTRHLAFVFGTRGVSTRELRFAERVVTHVRDRLPHTVNAEKLISDRVIVGASEASDRFLSAEAPSGLSRTSTAPVQAPV